MRGEDTSNVVTIPTQKTLTHQILSLCQAFKDLKQIFVVSRRTEQFHLHSHHRVETTVEDSVRRTEMGAPESQEEDVPRRILWCKTLGFLGMIRPH